MSILKINDQESRNFTAGYKKTAWRDIRSRLRISSSIKLGVNNYLSKPAHADAVIAALHMAEHRGPDLAVQMRLQLLAQHGQHRVVAHRLVLRAQDAVQTSPQKVLEDILATAPTPR